MVTVIGGILQIIVQSLLLISFWVTMRNVQMSCIWSVFCWHTISTWSRRDSGKIFKVQLWRIIKIRANTHHLLKICGYFQRIILVILEWSEEFQNGKNAWTFFCDVLWFNCCAFIHFRNEFDFWQLYKSA